MYFKIVSLGVILKRSRLRKLNSDTEIFNVSLTDRQSIDKSFMTKRIIAEKILF